MAYQAGVFKALGLAVPQGKDMELGLLLLCWTTAIVLLIVAWTRVSEVKGPAGEETYTTTIQDKLTQQLTLSSFVTVFLLLTFFLTLRVALAPTSY
jgi:multisubunit Na+/H+ antiporter MnhC subunit